ncbi:hypothetical protein [Bradyrhizobium sp.]|uniref:hypothetical protein n=1 Tax=Bradyrhizobium sp. TaxID=376 RepID=UPI002636834F|nr:hypothetical protein [Bradyrhizobium sp.]
MGLRFQAIVVTFAFISVTSCVTAQEVRNFKRTVATEMARPTLTGKERLGRKWSDEQRIDNCHVPLDKRGAKKRPSACPNDPSS